MSKEKLSAFEAMRESLDCDAKAKANQKAAIAERLGLTQDELALLLG